VLSHYVESFACFVAILRFEYWSIVKCVAGFGGSISFCVGVMEHDCFQVFVDEVGGVSPFL